MKIKNGLSLFLLCGATLPLLSAGAENLEFGEIIQISEPGVRVLAPDIAAGTDGGIHLLWVAKAPPPEADEHGGMNHSAADELYYRRLNADGSLENAVRVNHQSGEVWGFAVSKPELAVGANGVIHVMFPANAQQESTGKGILEARYTRSFDGGKSFAPSITLNSPAANDLSAVMHGGFAAAHAFGTVTADAQGGVHAYWIDTRSMTEESTAGALYVATSRDSGKTFAPDVPIRKDDVCPCCQLAADTQGDNVFLSSREVSEAGDRDSAVAVSADAGRNFSSPVRLGEGRWNIAGCPLKRTAIAVAGDQVYTAWYTAGQDPAGVWFARSSDGGQRFSKSIPLHPGAKVSDAPSVAALDNGMVFVAWHAKLDGPRRVFVSVSTDSGASFSAPVEAPVPDGTAAYPEIVASADGAYIAFQFDDAAYVLPVRYAPQAAASDRIRPISASEFAGVLAAERGNVVLVNFWATWCRPCLKEIPELTELAERYADRGFTLVPVSLDDRGDLQKSVVPFLNKWFPDLETYASLETQMDAMVSIVDPAWNEILPTSYIIDRDGETAATIQGGKSGAEFAALITPLLD